MYEAVHAVPEGSATVARLAATAREYGFEGIVVRNHGDARADYDAGAIGERYGVDVVSGVEIRAESPSRAAGFVGAHRPNVEVLALHGGTDALNRFAVEQERIDVLAHPTDGGDVNHVLARAAADNGVRLEFDFARILRGRGGGRTRAIADLRKLRELVAAYDAPYVVSADPTSHLELRAPRELLALGESIGFDAGQVEAGLREWGAIAAENRHRRSDAFIAPGVERGPYEEDDR